MRNRIIFITLILIFSSISPVFFFCNSSGDKRADETYSDSLTVSSNSGDEVNSNVTNTGEPASLNSETVNFQSVNIKLPEPKLTGNTPVEEAMLKRRSVRDFLKKPLSLDDVSQLLWSAQGITDKQRERRTAPSAGALYPLEIYITAGNITGLEQGIYKYKPQANELIKIAEGNYRPELSKYSAQPSAIQTAPVTLVFSAVYSRTSVKYGSRAERYVHIETGHASQNVCLQVISLGLSTVTIGAFQDEQVKKAMQMQENEEPLYIMPVGYGK